MSRSVCLFVFLALFGLTGYRATAQTPQPTVKKPDASAEIDSLRQREESTQDTVIFTSKYIRYTRLKFLDDSTYTLPIDTSLRNAQHYNPQNNPFSPSIHLGNGGLSSRDLLYTPRKNIGFDAGFHALDRFLYTQDSVNYYRARTPFTELYYVNGGQVEQYFNLIHTQNVKPNLNVGASYKRIGADGFYRTQRGDHTNVTVFTWYRSKNKRYNLLANALFNTLRAGENGSILNDSIFTSSNENGFGPQTEPTRLVGTGTNRPVQSWKERELFMKHFYYLGRLDSLNGDSATAVLPTQRVTYSLHYTNAQYKFFRNEPDTYGAFPAGMVNSTVLVTNDSTSVKTLANEFSYSFYLRGKSVSFLKNEVKLDVGLLHELVQYRQVSDSMTVRKLSFQNITLKGNAGYRFSDRVSLVADLQQVMAGRSFGNFLYEANASIMLSRSVGKVVLGAYLLNRTPEEIYRNTDYQFHKWNADLDDSKITSLSFSYQNPKYFFNAKAEYLLLNNYTYLRETAVDKQVEPVQSSANISLLKVSAAKDFRFGSFGSENYAVYQKTDAQDVLRTPELYLYNSFYYSRRIFKSIDAQAGFDSRYNTSFAAPAYAIDISQFYNDRSATSFSSYPVIDVWLKVSLRRATIFLKNNYINQGLFSKGYYTVNRYPMPGSKFLFSVKWDFYN
ncbi:putative porin [Hufsiella ginkgonis]|uniref:Porin n=1 Tax=Hufsiella ginkgonis TaxID=2695274 RepID=A0A7K1Y2P4_9SPHI|nr:putative porin [Hufsiella ginkgonis]MXV17492.1 hypothetical protein [Hufsiella ginkgonis]